MKQTKIHHTGVQLMPDVPLHVYAVEGDRYSVLIDTGIAPMRSDILKLCNDAKNLRYVVITHAHADHIGCNHAVKDATGASFAAAGALPWIENYETHINEFCLPIETGEYTPGQAEDVRSIMDQPVDVDLVIQHGDTFRLGDNTELKVIAVPGHKLEEIAFLEISSGILFMGDLLLALKAPFFHGFETVNGFHKSLDLIEALIHGGVIKQINAAHFDEMSAEKALIHINDTRNFLIEVEKRTIDASKGGTMQEIWKSVCAGMNKELEFRGFAMIRTQLDELLSAGTLKMEQDKWYIR
jgi:glyoxylase-like metal-dependent hydrolase (beta-lactamase superfamily II)